MHYKVLQYTEEAGEGFIKLKSIDRPSNEEQFRGLNIGEEYTFITTTYMNGFINLVEVEKAFLLFDGDYNEKDEILENIENVSEINWFHTNLGRFSCPVTVIGSLEDSYVVFFFDSDVSSCLMQRIDKNKYTLDDVTINTLQIMNMRQQWMDSACEEYVELPKPKGWIRY